jgi:hypothetical protein
LSLKLRIEERSDECAEIEDDGSLRRKTTAHDGNSIA